MLWRDLKVFQVFGANTDVGKTIIATLLCRVLQRRAPTNPLLYLKPVSAGPQHEADDVHITRFAPGVIAKCISQFSRPVSPHLAARLEDGTAKPTTEDDPIVSQVKQILSQHARGGGRHALLETAGGVLSPAPSGTPQADVYRPLRLPTILIGDSNLGGISTTMSAFESLHIRGYDVDAVALFDNAKWANAEYLYNHFQKYNVPTFALPMPPTKLESDVEDQAVLSQYYDQASLTRTLADMVEVLHKKHFERISKLISMKAEADEVLWHPFRQHRLPAEIIAIDAAYGDAFDAYRERSKDIPQSHKSSTSGSSITDPSPLGQPLLTPLFDGSASWWTQGLGHGNPDLALTAAHAAGRYGHVMFAHAVHQPALDISSTLLSTLKNPRLSRTFFTDNGSTGMEVAVKMALRASSARYDWDKTKDNIEILGLSGSYHGDTIGVMNCSEPNVFNEKVDWHRPWGFWFDPPQVSLTQGKWQVAIPESMKDHTITSSRQYDNLGAIFDYSQRESDAKAYEQHILSRLEDLIHKQKRKFGALIMEPILMGAGGMIFVDPLFQRMLIQTIRANTDLFTSTSNVSYHPDSRRDNWTGLPVIADEVFTGLYRLGRGSSSSFLSSDAFSNILENDIAPDICVNAKLLTGGLLPLAITTASEPIFETFLSDRKQDALLHGHSYTAHAIGCAVADRSLKEIKKLDEGAVWSEYKDAWKYSAVTSTTHRHHHHQHHTPPPWRPTPTSNTSNPTSSPPPNPSPNQRSPTFSFFSPTFLTTLSHHPKISSCFAIGTVLAMTVNSSPTPPHSPSSSSAPLSSIPSGSSPSTSQPPQSKGYTSTASASLQQALLNITTHPSSSRSSTGTEPNDVVDEPMKIHSRVLGDVLYIMTSLTTTPETVGRIEWTILQALG